VIIKASVWDQLAQGDRDKMAAAMKTLETTIRTKSASQDVSSINAMKQKGLNVIEPDKAAMDELRAAANEMTKSVGNVPDDVLKAAIAARDSVRKK